MQVFRTQQMLSFTGADPSTACSPYADELNHLLSVQLYVPGIRTVVRTRSSSSKEPLGREEPNPNPFNAWPWGSSAEMDQASRFLGPRV